MRLSDAMMLGSVTCRMKQYNWNSCALGCAGNAIGIPNWGNWGKGRGTLILEQWPWLLSYCPREKRFVYAGSSDEWDATYVDSITYAFDQAVCNRRITLESLIDWVRSVEPQPLALPAPAASFATTAVEEGVLAAL